jgi:hypothetical protein
LYDYNDPFSCKIIVHKKELDREISSPSASSKGSKGSVGSKGEGVENEQAGFEGGSIGSGVASGNMSGSGGLIDNFEETKEISFPSLDDALEMNLDLNSVTSMPQRLRNIN